MNNIEAINSWLKQFGQSATHICKIQLILTPKEDVEFQYHWVSRPIIGLLGIRGAGEITHTLLPHNIGIMWATKYINVEYMWVEVYMILTASMQELFDQMSDTDRLSIAEEAFQVYKRDRSFRDTTSIANKISNALSNTAGVPVESIAAADLF